MPGLAIAIVKDDRVMLAKIEMAEGKVMSLTLVQGPGPSLRFIAEAIVRNSTLPDGLGFLHSICRKDGA